MTNALSILVELDALLERYRRDGTPGTITLSLLPLSDEEVEFVDARLGRGPVDILSRSYGKCQIISTNTRDVWWVRYYNSMSTLILNTIEVTRVPEVVCAAPEDLADSAQRLDEILNPYELGLE
jgi:hydrogenase-1 operon protein HyaF